MQYWKVKTPIIKGSNYTRVIKEAREVFHQLERKTKRRVHLRSRYFKSKKVFLSIFWDHLNQKNQKDKRRRLRYYPCALELIEMSTLKPTTTHAVGTSKEVWHRFYGEIHEEKFVVQIKETKNGELHLMSIFPEQ